MFYKSMISGINTADKKTQITPKTGVIAPPVVSKTPILDKLSLKEKEIPQTKEKILKTWSTPKLDSFINANSGRFTTFNERAENSSIMVKTIALAAIALSLPFFIVVFKKPAIFIAKGIKNLIVKCFKNKKGVSSKVAETVKQTVKNGK